MRSLSTNVAILTTLAWQPHIHAFIAPSPEAAIVTSPPTKDERIDAALDRLLFRTVLTGFDVARGP
ncbi:MULTISPECIES: hypothetical protein [Lonsdalea]|uniref:Uncharacterized protein n=2 Tax=Lonsdalea TaxID=1082702 RepID=A0ACD1J8X2_9GAMM|nr:MULTISPECIES: hypothetical protein [Lonsdalea]OSN00819.1 hypothetical protein AU499_09685 [Lonsdalea populi]QPQ24260.1 hypothetical protein I6N93_00065 [Lonsdalea populi]RAT11358.1 hypothetical protein AU485_14610 [Lonsdalea quercina]RAT17159.1 hypothetical protein AU486_05715 [Lonsdalea quercina]RAT23230.1 hypothetical protein AU487_01475 [Lonsdalea populi]